MFKILAHMSHSLIMSGSTYVRFAHIRFGNLNLFYLLEWTVTIALLFAFCFGPLGPKQRRILTRLRRFASHKRRAILIVFSLSLFGRLALLTIEPFPAPAVHDEFSYLLGADTFAHGHLTSPTPRDSLQFQTFHVLLEPTYTSMYPPASALFYGFGQAVFGTPRAGLLLLMALACAALCWMLQAFVPPEWALLGGLLSVVHISWFSYFGNTYWGGATAMLAGCLLLGAGRRLLRENRTRVSTGIILSLSLLLLLNNRPFEGGILSLSLLIYLASHRVVRARIMTRAALPALLILLIGCIATAYYAFTVTHGLKLPWSLQRQQWAITPPFMFQHAAYSHSYQFQDQRDFYAGYELQDYNKQQTLTGYLRVQADKAFREWLFFVSPALTPCLLLGLLPTFRSGKCRPLLLILALMSLGFLVQTWVQPQYVAVATGIIYLLLINGLRTSIAMAGKRTLPAAIFPATIWSLLVILCLRLVLVPVVPWPQSWYTRGSEMVTFEKLQALLNRMPGKQLVLVRYAKNHRWQDSWIDNGANLATQKVIWARDLPAPAANTQLLCDYADRTVWLLTPPEGEQTDPDRTDPARRLDVSGLLQPYKRPGTCPE